MEPDDHISQQGAAQPGERSAAEPVAQEGKKKKTNQTKTKPNKACWVAGSRRGSFTIRKPLSDTENSREWRILQMKNTEMLRKKENNV